MKLLVKPSDLIKRFIWDKYETYCLHTKNKADVEKIIKEDLEFEISENDAFVIGFTNVIYTDQIVYKFKQHLKDVLENKSFDHAEKSEPDPQKDDESEDNDEEVYTAPKLMINKDIMIENAKSFLNKIPKSWDYYNNESVNFSKQMSQIPALTKEFIEKLNKLVIVNINDWECLKYVSVKKLINKVIR